MARYFDADKFIEDIQETICSKCDMYDGIKCKDCGLIDVFDLVDNVPTADVVPKSEVERLYYNLQAVLEERAETKQEIAREIFEELEMIMLDGEIGGKYAAKVINPDKYAVLKKKYTEGE